MGSDLKSVPQTKHRVLFKFNKTLISKEFLENIINSFGFRLSKLISKRIRVINNSYSVQIDLEHPTLPDPRGTLITLFDLNNREIKSWYQVI